MAWEDPDLDGAALDLLLDGALDGVCGAQPAACVLGECEDGEAFGDVSFEPDREVGGVATISCNEAVERLLCGSYENAETGADALHIVACRGVLLHREMFEEQRHTSVQLI